MKQKQFLNSLRECLKKLPKKEADEIINDYEEHFAQALSEGYREEDVARKLGSPNEIASQFINEFYFEKNEAKMLKIKSNSSAFKRFLLYCLMFIPNIIIAILIFSLLIVFIALDISLIILGVVGTVYAFLIFDSISLIVGGALVCIGSFFLGIGLTYYSKSVIKYFGRMLRRMFFGKREAKGGYSNENK